MTNSELLKRAKAEVGAARFLGMDGSADLIEELVGQIVSASTSEADLWDEAMGEFLRHSNAFREWLHSNGGHPQPPAIVNPYRASDGASCADVAGVAEDRASARTLVAESEAIAHAHMVRSRTISVNLRDLTDPAVTDPMKAEARADAVKSIARKATR